MVKRKKKNEKRAKIKLFLKNFFNSKHPIIITLILIIFGLLIFINHLMNNTKTYLFNGLDNYVRILNGVIVIDDRLAMFEGSDIDYINKKDIKVKSYTLGYFVEVGNKLMPIIAEKGNDEKGLSLKGLIEEKISFNITESLKNNKIFTDEVIKEIENNLYFVIDIEDLKENKIESKIKIDLEDLSN